MSTNILLCCPFCGGEAIVTDYSDPGVNYPGWIAECKSCQAMIDEMYDTKHEAISAWNRRAPALEPVPDGVYGDLYVEDDGKSIAIFVGEDWDDMGKWDSAGDVDIPLGIDWRLLKQQRPVVNHV